MTKAKARARAKAKAGQKAKKRGANADQPSANSRPGGFDPGNSSIKSPRAAPGGKSSTTMRRGNARSR